MTCINPLKKIVLDTTPPRNAEIINVRKDPTRYKVGAYWRETYEYLWVNAGGYSHFENLPRVRND